MSSRSILPSQELAHAPTTRYTISAGHKQPKWASRGGIRQARIHLGEVIPPGQDSLPTTPAKAGGDERAATRLFPWDAPRLRDIQRHRCQKGQDHQGTHAEAWAADDGFRGVFYNPIKKTMTLARRTPNRKDLFFLSDQALDFLLPEIKVYRSRP